ncbi:MAG: DUF2207 domain-containing protein [Oligoflexia bacterium]|nr:DUF2207 domain-containing protein [Oligoflexia bacterium]
MHKFGRIDKKQSPSSKRQAVLVAIIVFCFVALLGVPVLVMRDAAPLPMIDAEPVQQMSSEVRVKPDGSIDVTEIYRIASEGKQLKHGILRAFPLAYVDEFGAALPTTYTGKSALRNGLDLHWTNPAPEEGFTLFYLGDENIPLEQGMHEFVFSYNVQGRVGKHDAAAYLSWEVNPYWPIATQQIVAEVKLPAFVEAASVTYAARIIGPTEDLTQAPSKSGNLSPVVKAEFFDAGKLDPTARDVLGVRFQMLRNLQPYERLLVTVWWPEGFMKR